MPHARVMTADLRSLDEVDLVQVLEVMALAMKSIPKFVTGVFQGSREQ